MNEQELETLERFGDGSVAALASEVRRLRAALEKIIYYQHHRPALLHKSELMYNAAAVALGTTPHPVEDRS